MARCSNPGVVDQDVQPAEGADGCFQHAQLVVMACNVGLNDLQLVAAAARRVGELLEQVQRSCGGEDAGAAPGRLVGECLADALRGAGDENARVGNATTMAHEPPPLRQRCAT